MGYRKLSTEPERVQQYDRGQLLRSVRTPEGYLLTEGVAAVAGVMTYIKNGQIQRQLLPPEELGDAESLATLARQPLTLEHPPAFLTPATVQQHQVGDVGDEVVFDNGFVRVRTITRQADAVAALDARTVTELSPGYTCRLDPTPGVWQGEAYDVVQRDRRYNHLALTKRARGGRECVVQLDSSTAYQLGENAAEETMSLKDLKIGEVTYQLDAEIVDALQADALTHTTAMQQLKDAHLAAVKQHKDELAAKVKAHCDMIDQLKGSHDAAIAEMQKKHAELEAKLAEAAAANATGKGPGALEEAGESETTETTDAAELVAFAARTKLVNLATRLKVEQIDAMPTASLKRAICAKAKADFKPEATEQYVDAFVDVLLETVPQVDASQQAAALVAAGLVPGGQAEAATSPEIERAKAQAEYRRNTFGG
jgi:hypothetical protein